MSSYGEKIVRAQAAQSARPIYKDVTVSLDSALADERAELIRQIGALNQERQSIVDAAKGVLTLSPDTSAVDKKANAIAAKIKKIDRLEQDSLITVRVYRAKGDEWMDLKAGNPARLNSAIDRGVGYNVNTLTVAACVLHGRVVEGEQESQPTQDEWASLFALLAGGEFERIVDLVYQVNVADSQQRTESLKNYFEAATASAKK
jgi:hypothetical protein